MLHHPAVPSGCLDGSAFRGPGNRRGFGAAGQGFLRFSCAETDERMLEAVEFLKVAITRTDRVKAYLEAHPKYKV